MYIVSMLLRFEWDEQKAAENLRKHGVSFRESRAAFTDENHVELFDESHSEDEGRFSVVGFSEKARLVRVTYTARGNNVRIITARPATKKERKYYENQKD
jgi:uncharacterized protein